MFQTLTMVTQTPTRNQQNTHESGVSNNAQWYQMFSKNVFLSHLVRMSEIAEDREASLCKVDPFRRQADCIQFWHQKFRTVSQTTTTQHSITLSIYTARPYPGSQKHARTNKKRLVRDRKAELTVLAWPMGCAKRVRNEPLRRTTRGSTSPADDLTPGIVDVFYLSKQLLVVSNTSQY